jgi:hypothetical protein
MKLHPKVKMICEEFADSYEWIEGDESLFVKLSNRFVDIVKERLQNCPLEFQDSQKVGDNSILWFRSAEENEPVYDFEDEDDE